MNNIDKYSAEIVLPRPESRKGENGRVLVIGGSKLFHAASFWSASMASKIVDMVHFSSPAMENNELMRVKAKAKFWDGIVVPWEEVEHYIQEDDCILIGPGMERGEETKKIVNELLAKYPEKKWVVDGGALQEMDPRLLTPSMVVTPNLREQEILSGRVPEGVTVLAKGQVDVVSLGGKKIEIEGGNAGMTKGGTGDVLAGIVAGLYAKSSAMASCVVASRVNKLASEELSREVGPYFSASDLMMRIQKNLGQITVRS